MSKKKSNVKKSFPPTDEVRRGAQRASGPTSSWFSAKAIREAIESITVAFILAFVFRTFEAEAFVIPTGSMAPTLLGQNKDLWCPECGYHYQAGASSEDDQLALQRGLGTRGQEVVAVTCPLCRYTANVDPGTTEGREYPSYGGDRILASKLAYEFSQPRRWDIALFKYPGGAQTNYIKRLVGLPRETLRIWHGDLYVQADGADNFAIERRSPAKLRAMAQIVYDNDYLVDEMTQKGWPLRWQAWPAGQSSSSSAWTSTDGGRSYSIDGSASEAKWIRYRHFVPSLDDWEVLKSGSLGENYQAKPSLITDFYAYDTSVTRGQLKKQPHMLGLHWVGDLMLECELNATTPNGAVLLDLVKGGRHFGCELDCATGQARLSIDGMADFHPTAETFVRGAGSHRVAFANIDEQLLLWIDGRVVSFDGTTTYEPLGNDVPRFDSQDPLDLAPAGIASRSCGLQVNHMRLWRDLYYISAPDGRVVDYEPASELTHMNYDQLLEFWSTPQMWAPAGRSSPFDRRREAIFPLAADQFFMLGDNSPASQDARLWPAESYVSRDLLIGKSLLIFWPHSFDKVPGTNIPFPFFPNFARMGTIR
jgi:signal peptidase I